jgi:transcription elongation factor GreA
MDMSDEHFVLTPAGYENLRQELAALEARYNEDEAEFKDVNYSNDPSKEEAAYVETRISREHDEERIGHLRLILENAVILDEDVDPAHVDPGERVTVWDFAEKQEIQFDLLGPEEVIAGRRGVAIDSPVGKALIGKQVGDVVEVEVPDGTVRYAIRNIERVPGGQQSDQSNQAAAV